MSGVALLQEKILRCGGFTFLVDENESVYLIFRIVLARKICIFRRYEMKNLTGCKLLIGTLIQVLCIGPDDKLSKNIMVDEAIKLRPDTKWCLQEKPGILVGGQSSRKCILGALDQ
jgi:hypothetical protein